MVALSFGCHLWWMAQPGAGAAQPVSFSVLAILVGFPGSQKIVERNRNAEKLRVQQERRLSHPKKKFCVDEKYSFRVSSMYREQNLKL